MFRGQGRRNRQSCRATAALGLAVALIFFGIGAAAQTDNVEVVVWDTGPSIQGDDGAIVTISGPVSYEFYAGPDEDQSNPHPLYLPAGDYAFTVTAVWPQQPNIDGTSDSCRRRRCRNNDIAAFYIDFRGYESFPTAEDDIETTDEDTPVAVSVLDNDDASTRILLDGSEDSSVAFQTETLRRTTGPDLCCGDLGYPESQTFDLTIDIGETELDIVWVGTPSHGSATARPDGTILYTPDSDYCGTDQFEYTIEDSNGSDTATVFIEIACVSDPPVAEDDDATTDENDYVNIDVAANDSDPDGSIDASSVDIVQTPRDGDLDVDPASGVVTYTPDPGTCGVDSFTYRVSDFDGTPSNDATVTIDVVCNEAPVAGDDVASTNENTSIGINVLSNDSDADGSIDPATVLITSDPMMGELSVHPPTGAVTYTPDPGTCGMDTFRYTVDDDDAAASNPATVTVEVLCDDPPLAVDDLYTVAEGDRLDVSAPGILANDETNPEEPISAQLVSDVSHGTLQLNADGSFIYDHDGSETTSDSFRYLATDGTDDSNVATVSLVITPTNDQPTAQDDEDSTNEDTPVTVGVLANDSDPDGDILSVDWVGAPSHGQAANNGSSVTYTPAPNVHGTDSFSYGVTDGNGGSATATVTIAVDSVNDPPQAQNDSAQTDEDEPVTVSVLDNDSDPDGDSLEIQSVTQPDHGPVTHDGTRATYDPDPNFHGVDAFTYTVTDRHGGTSTATVSLTVDEVNDEPVARDDEASTDEDTPISIDVLRNDDDPDGDDLAVQAVGQPSNGSAANHGTDVTYTPDPDFHGVDTFTYVTSDGRGGTATATVTVTVLPVNDPPLAQDDAETTDEDVPVSIFVLDNDSDLENDALSVESVTSPSHGTAEHNGIAVIYTPDADFHGTDTFAYTMADEDGAESTAQVTVIVIAVNDPPTARDDSETTNEDEAITVNVLANDDDPDGDALVVQSVTQPATGSAVNNGSSVTYTPDPNVHGVDTFEYTVSDRNGGTESATVEITINPVNDPPIAQDDSDATNEDTPLPLDVLANDSDPDGDALVVQSVTQPPNGSVVNNGSSVTYTPDPDFHGIDTFTYTVSDGVGGTESATVSVSVKAVNDPPIAFDDADTTDEDTPITLDVLVNDSDPDGDALVVQSVTQPPNGSVVNNGSDVTYTPDTNVHGTDVFTYTVSDGNGGSEFATVEITIDPVNDPPIAQDDSDTTDEDVPVTIGVLANDSDADGDSLSVQSVTQPAHGSVVHDGAAVTYTPGPNYHGTDAFTYTVSDANGGTDTATVTVIVSAVNDPPIAQDDSDTTDEDAPVTIGVLTNDTDPDGDNLSVQSVAQPTHGSTARDGTQITYTPGPNYHGTDAFTYTVSDGNGGTDSATVEITIDPVNDPPIAQDDSDTTDEDVAVTVDVLGNDSDPDGDSLVVQSVTQPTNGSVLNNGSDVTYTPDPGFNGADAFTYALFDGNGGTDTAAVSISIGAVNDSPIAEDDSDTTDEDVAVTIGVLGNDSDPDGDSLVVQSVTQPTNGSVLNNGSDVTYTPHLNFHGSDLFTYTVSDGNGGTESATVTVTVNEINDPPIAQDDSDTTDEDTPITIDVLVNDGDADGDSLVVQSVTQPTNGSVFSNGSDVIYTPNPGYNGADAFTYVISDGSGGTDTANVSISIGAVNDPPIANEDTDATDEDTPVTVDVLGNDSDPDGDALIVQSVTQPTDGSVVNNGSDVTYTPDLNYHGSDLFTYTVSDGNGGTDTASVQVTIASVNDAPIAQDDSDATEEDTPMSIDVLGNDTDPDGDSLVVQSVAQPAHGSVATSGSDVVYTPNPGYNGSDAFTYVVSDGNGGTDTASVSVSISAVNDSPVAVDDADATDEDTPVTIDVLGNDTDPDGDVLIVQSVTQPAHGSVANSGSDVVYTPDPNVHGSDVFTYTISDGNGGTDTATVQVVIESVNDAPVAQDDSDATDEDVPVTIDVLGNDSDPDGDALIVQSVTQPAHGSVVHDGAAVAYTPDPGYNGADAFTYTVSDGVGGTDTANVSISIGAVNDPPIAVDDTDATDEDVAVTIDVLGNDTDPDGDTLIVQSVTQPTNGSVVNNGSDVSYRPDAEFSGSDSFTYTISDGNGGSATATVTVSVDAVNDPPMAQDNSDATDEGVPVTVDVLNNDSDPDGDSLVVQAVTQPANGTTSQNGSAVTYTSNPGFDGSDSFTYTISDGNGGTATATVTIAVSVVNDPPLAVDDTASTSEDSPATIAVLTNDSDPDGDALAIQSVTQPSSGAVAPSGSSVIYTPAPNTFGADTFTYTISDGFGGTDTATVTVEVIAANDPPNAQDDSSSTGEDRPVEILVLINDSDPDGDTLAVQSIAQPTNGAASNNGNSVTYTPALGFSGTDTFAYTLSDGNGGTDTASVIVSVAARNNPPVAQDDSAVTEEGTLISVPVLGNDSDPDGDFLLIESFSNPANGMVLNARTGVSYIPDPDFQGVDSFIYTVSDGNGGTDTATVTVSVAGVNDPPTAVDDNGVVDEGSTVSVPVLLNDSDPDGDTIRVESVQQPLNGTVTTDGATASYTPDPGFSGVDQFSYTLSDGRGGTSTATVFVAVAAVNDSPIAQDDSASTELDGAIGIQVIDNDSDPDGDTLAIESVTQPANGSVAIDGASLIYTPTDGFSGTDTFSYTVADTRGNTDTATVTVGVAGEAGAGGAAAPTACDQRVIINEIAWAGTAADPRDEWIELRNLGTTTVDLEGWELRWRRTHPSTPEEQLWKVVELSGTLRPSSGAACEEAIPERETRPIRLSKEDPDDAAWRLSSEIGETDTGYFVLERRREDTLTDTRADLVYDTARTLQLELSDLGEVLMLVNADGEVVDTANASNLGRDGWVAGSAATFGAMERIDPLAADTAQNWQTNAGIVSHGTDAKGHLVRATPGGDNSPVFDAYATESILAPKTVRAGETLSVDFDLPRQERRSTGWPWISVSRPGFTGAGGAGGMADLSGYSFSGTYAGGSAYQLDIGTQGLTPGTYIFWITYGRGTALLVPIIVGR